MKLAYDSSSVEKLWAELPYTGFTRHHLVLNRTQWEAGAKEILSLLPDTNLIVQMGTAGGKTILALLAILGFGSRALFLVPTRLLASQHQKLFTEGIGIQGKTQVIIGTTPRKQRHWNDQEQRITFATPQTFKADLQKNLIRPELFSLVIIDEAHRASGEYDYTFVAEFFVKKATPLLGLSASAAATPEKLATLVRLFGNARVLPLSTKKPFTPCDFIYIPLTPAMRKAEEKEWKSLLRQALRQLEIRYQDLPKNLIFTQKEIGWLRKDIGALPDSRAKFEKLTLLALYGKLLYAYRVFMTESFFTFLAYVEKLRSEDTSIAAKKLLAHTHFRSLIRFAENHMEVHPKAEVFLKVIKQRIRIGKTSVVFLGEKQTALALQTLMAKHDIVAQTVFGGKGRNIKSRQNVIEKFQKGEFLVILATSVIEEGIAIPEVDTVINYSLPQTAISRLQRSGRTGRVQAGFILSLVMEHPFDTSTYWRGIKSEQAMKQFLKTTLPPSAAAQTSPSPVTSFKKRPRRRGKKDVLSGELFPETLDVF